MTRDLFHDIAQFIIGLVLLLAGFTFLYMIFFSGQPIAAEFRESLFQVTGGVLGLIGVVVGFYFGTSLSSARKDSTISKVTTKE
jgi:hypothetical protein